MSYKPKSEPVPVGFVIPEEKYVTALVNNPADLFAFPPEVEEANRLEDEKYEAGERERKANRQRLQWEEDIARENKEESKRLAESERCDRRVSEEAARASRQQQKQEDQKVSKQFLVLHTSQAEQKKIDRTSESAASLFAEMTKFRSYFLALPQHCRDEKLVEALKNNWKTTIETL